MEKHFARCWGGWIHIYLIISAFSRVKPDVFLIKHNSIVKASL
jgi:hypothetical protein